MGDESEEFRTVGWEDRKSELHSYLKDHVLSDDENRNAQYEEVYTYLVRNVIDGRIWYDHGYKLTLTDRLDAAKKAPDVRVYLKKIMAEDAVAEAKSEQDNKDQKRRLAEEKQREKNRAELRENEKKLYARLAEERKVELELARKQTSGGPTGQTATGPLFGMAYSVIQVSAFGHLALPEIDFRGSDRFTSFM